MIDSSHLHKGNSNVFMEHTAPVDGMLLVDKPPGMTSHDVVAVVRRKLTIQRIGHTGTLDPMAQGLLILLIGRATAHQRAFQAHEKTYEAILHLGTQTDTGDAMGRRVRTAAVPPLEPGRVAARLASWRGPLAQRPPAYSAIKVRGRPAYWWARRHQPLTLPTRLVHLADISLIDCSPPTITFRVRCSAGTYIRTLAESIAEQLGTVGHLSRLVRLQIGDWHLDDAKPLPWIETASPDAVIRALQSVPG